MNSRIIACLLTVSGVVSATAQEPSDTVPAMQAESLDEVVVTATRKTVTTNAEKTTYDVAADPEAQALTLLDLLRKVPGVVVDAQDNITVNGSSDFSVEVDGRPNPMFSSQPGKVFKSIPAQFVQRVEVINSPGARYDAEGVGGVLNIVMKGTNENLDGYSLTVGADGGNFGGGLKAFAMMQKGPIGVSFNLAGAHNEMPSMTLDMSRSQDNGATVDYYGRLRNRFDYGFAQLDLTAALSAHDKLAVSASWNISRWAMRMNSSVFTRLPGTPDTSYGLGNTSDGHSNAVSAGADYSHFFGENQNHKIRFSYQFDSQPSRNETNVYYYILPSSVVDLLPENVASLNRTNMPQHMALTEYALPINDRHSIELGGKMTWRNSTSRAIDLDYDHRTRIAAGYLSYALKAGDFSAKAGIRYEHTAQKAFFHAGQGTDFSADYNNFVPSFSAAWSFSGINSLSVAYDMRISRPGIEYLNPYVQQGNPLDIRVGNPYLKPERHNNLTLAYTSMFGPLMLSSKLNYSFCHDGFTELIDIQDGLKYTTYANALHSKRVSLQIYANLRLGTKTSIQCSMQPQFSSMRALTMANHGWDFNVFAGVQQKLPWKLDLGVNIFAMTPMTNLQGRGPSQFIHMLTLGRSFLKDDRLNVTLQALCPFYGKLNLRSIENGPGFSSSTLIGLNMRMVQVSVSLRIGNLKTKVDSRDKLDSDAVGGSSSSSGSSPAPAIGM